MSADLFSVFARTGYVLSFSSLLSYIVQLVHLRGVLHSSCMHSQWAFELYSHIAATLTIIPILNQLCQLSCQLIRGHTQKAQHVQNTYFISYNTIMQVADYEYLMQISKHSLNSVQASYLNSSSGSYSQVLHGHYSIAIAIDYQLYNLHVIV